MLSVLSQVFQTERHRPRAGEVGRAVPFLSEIAVGAGGSMLATNMNGEFRSTRRSEVTGYARFGFCFCELYQEYRLLVALHRALVDRHGAVASIADALKRMGDRAKVVLGSADLSVPDGLRHIELEFPMGRALVMATAASAGHNTRIGDYVGVLAQSVDTAFVAVAL